MVCRKKYSIILPEYIQTFIPGLEFQYIISVKTYNGEPADRNTPINVKEYFWNNTSSENKTFLLHKNGLVSVTTFVPINATNLIIEVILTNTLYMLS